MMEVSAQSVKMLRTRTGAGMMDCKSALAECSGDMEASIDWLRKKGYAKMAKKSDRQAQEGLVALATENSIGAIIELSSETDFVARNEEFNQAAQSLAELALVKRGDLASAELPNGKGLVEDYVRDLASKLGENISLKRTKFLAAPEGGLICSYLHNKQGKKAGKVGVLVALKKGDEEIGRQIAMHISAARPLAVSKEDISLDLIERERSVLLAQAKEEGKPEDIAKKIVEGRLRKFYNEVALLEQEFVLDDDLTISKLLAEKNAEVESFLCFALGED